MNKPSNNPFIKKATVNFYKQKKQKIDLFVSNIVRKYKSNIIGILIITSEEENIQKHPDKEQTNDLNNKVAQSSIFILIKDITRGNIKEKALKIVNGMKEELRNNKIEEILIEIIHLKELWIRCEDKKNEFLNQISNGIILNDNGFLETFIIAIQHKNKVLKKFEKYVLCYTFSGSTVKGLNRKKSDLDIFIVIDDTDVKKISIDELKGKLRIMIQEYGIELAEKFKTKLNINVQTYILTEYWEGLLNCNPTIYTLLRDGIPLYDKGLFVAWKKLLEMGKLRPSLDAIEVFIYSSQNCIKNCSRKLNDIIGSDLYWGLLSLAQASLMLKGFAPTTPNETINNFESEFSKSPYNFLKRRVMPLKKLLIFRKNMEYENRKKISLREFIPLYKSSFETKEAIELLIDRLKKELEVKKLNNIYNYFEKNMSKLLREFNKLFNGKIKTVSLEKFFSSLLNKNIYIESFLEKVRKISINSEKVDKSNLIKIYHIEHEAKGKIEMIFNIIDVFKNNDFEVVSNQNKQKWVLFQINNGAIGICIKDGEVKNIIRIFNDNTGKIIKHVFIKWQNVNTILFKYNNYSRKIQKENNNELKNYLIKLR